MAVVFSNTAAQRLSITSNVLSTNRQTDFYTIMAWVRPTTLPTSSNIDCVFAVNNNDISGAGFYDMLQYNSSGAALLYVSGEANAGGTVLFAVNTWVHVALVRESSTVIKIYGNAGLIGTTTQSSPADSTSLTRTEIGGATSGNLNIINARISRIKAWTTGLTLAEIQAEYRTIRPVRLADLYGFWPTWGDTGDGRATDYSGNGHTWTIGGTLAEADDPPVSYGDDPLTMVELAAPAAPPEDKVGDDSFTLTEDAATVEATNPVTASDALTLTEATATTTAEHTRTDTLTATEATATVTSDLTATDSATGTETPAVLAAAQMTTDSATLTESAAIIETTTAVTASDSATLTESTVTTATLTGTDSATLTEAAAVPAAALTGSDSATLSEAAAAPAAAITVSDSLTLTEAAASQAAAVTATDSAALAEATAILAAALTASDTGTLTESPASVPEAGGMNLSASDSFTFTESAEVEGIITYVPRRTLLGVG